MIRTRLIVFATAIGLACSFLAPLTAHASFDFTCRSDLIKDRFDAVDAVINASHNFTRDVTSFIDVDAGSTSELRSDFFASRHDLAVDLREGLRDVNDARRQSLSDLRSECNASTRRIKRELAFYTRMDNSIYAAYHKARHALRKAYLASIAACCVS